MAHSFTQSQYIQRQPLAEQLRAYLVEFEEGKPFTLNEVVSGVANGHNKRATISKTLSRFVQSGLIDRVTRGVFVKPTINRFVGRVPPNLSEVIQVIAKERNETIQTHGAEAVRQFKLSTQMPTQPVYYTSGRSRQIKMGNLTIRFVHTSNKNKLQHAGEKSGAALSALFYMGNCHTNRETIEHIHNELNAEEFQTLCQSSMPKWMSKKLNQYIRYS